MVGVLMLAAGVPRAFEHRDFDIVFVGYLVMRAGLVTLWLRARPSRSPNTAGPRGATPGRVPHHGRVGRGGAARVAGVGVLRDGRGRDVVSPWAERGGDPTPWHPEHIAERYGLFTIIVLGETILSSSVAFQSVVDEKTGDVTSALTAVGALLTVFAMWWVYFAKPAAPRLVSNRVAYPWGYGHYVVFASAAAVGAGVAVFVDHVTGATHISATAAAAAFTIPVILYLLAITFIHTLLYGVRREHLTAMLAAIVLVGLATFTGQPVLLTGVVLAVLVGVLVALHERASH